MNTLHRLTHHFSAAQLIILGFGLLALLGGTLLTLPIATVDDRALPFVDALFMATSAVTTTGLGVVGIGSTLNGFGQFIMLILIQIGGLGYMTFIVALAYLFGQRLTMRSSSLLEQSLPLPGRGDIRSFIRHVLRFTFFFEGAGALALTLFWWPEMGLGRAAYFGIFHAVSTFCTAGFALFDDGFVRYQDNIPFNLIITVLSLAGAVGFLILLDLERYLRAYWAQRYPRRLTVHSRLSLVTFAFLVMVGVAVLYWRLGAVAEGRLTVALFHAFTAATTTGFNTINIAELDQSALTFLLALMFIGAPAGGTGGGIKATTFGVALLLLRATLAGHSDVNAFGRRLRNPTVRRAVGVAISAALGLVIVTFFLTVLEDAPFLALFFEATSALGTVGLSTGITAFLTPGSKGLLIAAMLAGRVGPLGVAYSVVRNQPVAALHYAEEELFVG